MLTRRKTRSSIGDAADPAAAAAQDDNAAAAAGNGKSRRGKGAFGNRARNAANVDASEQSGKAAAGGAKRGRSLASSSAAAASSTAGAGGKRTTRSKSNGRAKLATAAAAAVAGKKRKAAKAEPPADNGATADAKEEEAAAKSNKRIKKEPRRGSPASSSSEFAAPAVRLTHLTTASPSSRVIIPTASQRPNAEEDVKKGRSDSKKPSASANAPLVPPEYRLVRPTFDGTNLTTGLAPQDVAHRTDTLRAAPYVADMFQHFYAAETSDAPTEYMDDQPDINAKMRAILIDWLVEVHMKFRLVPETLYLCVNLIDRYCQLVDIKRSELQLVGVTALLIACKYEEIYPPEVRDCVYITDRAYLRQQVLDMEQDILSKLEFRITVPTAYPFLCRYLDLVDAPALVRHAASFYMERTLQEHDLLHYRPSLVAASAVILAMRNPSLLRQLDRDSAEDHRAWLSAHNRPGIPQVLLEYTGFAPADIREVNAIVCTKVAEEPVTASRRQLVAVKRKWDNAKFDNVSTEHDLPLPSHVG